MQSNLTIKHQARIVRISDKAGFNRQWAELVKGIQELPECSDTDPVDENPLIEYVFGHRKLDHYLAQLRNRTVR
ncbi:MAG: hypothetical protein HOH33_02915 [Verrucomicrobia bacterium]|jgi:hypothetical protein|nr:hypothetical protein [Verrucomicrobiota bacterium]